MKNTTPFWTLIFLIMLAACGCIHLPSPVINATSDVGGSKISSVTPRPLITPATSQSTGAIQRLVNWQAGLFIAGGIALLALAGFLGYAGQIVPAIKIGIAGLLLPIFGIWFAYHWLAVVIIALLSAAGFFLATHFSIVKPLLQKIESEALKISGSVSQPQKKT